MIIPFNNPASNILIKSVTVSSLILVGVLSGHQVSGQEISLREENRTIKTYPFSDPNPIPSLGISAKVAPFYPYFIFDGYTNEAINKQWKVVTLENEFIEVTVLPEQGGKVMGAIEKSTGEEFIYLNDVQKFRAIGIRGPWTSGGIEHNFGLDLGHAPWTATEVDYVLKENADGSVSCVVGGLDLASRTQWRVDIRLPNDKAYFETNSMWYNPTPLHDAYLSWENAAFKATDDLQFYFPGTHYIGHSGDVHSWPIDKEGRNLSIYKENNFGSSKSYHVFGLFPNWYGGYFHNSDFGYGHWAPYDDAPGKKIWIWSLARDGAIWEKLLTDTHGQYIEAQSGIKLNQASPESGFNTPFNQLYMRPFYTETKSEYWFPVKETAGMVDASPTGTLNLVTSKDSLFISFCPNIPIKDSLTVSSGGTTVLSEFLQLKPMQVYHKSIFLTDAGVEILKVNIGQHLLSYTSDVEENRITRPLTTPAGQDFNSAEHLFRVADDLNAMRDYQKALETYLECLTKEPTHSRALSKVAELHYRKGQYKEALNYARKVLENNTYDGGGNFIYGIIQKALGNNTNAIEAFSIAVRSMEYRSAAYLQIAGLYLQDSDFRKTKAYAEKSLDYNRYNITAHELLGTALRKLQLADEARNAIDVLLEIDPLNHHARFEQYLLNPAPGYLSAFTSVITNELPFETYLELAIEYANHGLEDEAIQVLEQSPEYPTVKYWLAYLNRGVSPDKSEEYLKQAVEMSPLMAFPFRLETIPVLIWAREQNSSWKTNYYLGLIYWKLNRTKNALQEFDNCADSPDFAPFYISRGILIQNSKSGDAAALEDFERALKLDPEEWRAWYYLVDYYQKNRSIDKMLEFSGKMYNIFPDNPAVGIAHARSLLISNNNKECLKVLANVNVLPSEFANAGRGIYERAHLSIAMDLIEKKKYKKAIEQLNSSREWPENLGMGKPYEPDTRLQDFMAAYCDVQLGNQDIGDDYYQKIIDYSHKHWNVTEDPYNYYFAPALLIAENKPQEAADAFEKWETEQNLLRDWRISPGSSSPEVQWVLAKLNDERKKVKELEHGVLEYHPDSKFGIFIRAINQLDQQRLPKKP